MKKDSHPVILLSASRWYALSARLAIALIRHGARVSAICPEGHPLKFVPGIESLYRYHGLRSLGALKAAILSVRPDIVVPCDDGVVLQLHALHDREPSLRPLIEHSLGEAEAYPILDSRYRLLQVAAELGIRVPHTQAIQSEAELPAWPSASAVLKADGSMGGEGTAIAQNPAEMIAAYRKLARPITAFAALKRTVINRRPLSIWLWQRLGKPSITIQEFIPGRPANTMIACWRGEMLASVTVEVLSSQGATGAATVVRLIRHREIEQTSQRLAQRLRLTGFYGLDFILQKKDGDAKATRRISSKSTPAALSSAICACLTRQTWRASSPPGCGRTQCRSRGTTASMSLRVRSWPFSRRLCAGIPAAHIFIAAITMSRGKRRNWCSSCCARSGHTASPQRAFITPFANRFVPEKRDLKGRLRSRFRT